MNSSFQTDKVTVFQVAWKSTSNGYETSGSNEFVSLSVLIRPLANLQRDKDHGAFKWWWWGGGGRADVNRDKINYIKSDQWKRTTMITPWCCLLTLTSGS